MVLRIFSGNCCEGDIGLTVDAKDVQGKDLHTGDIVLLYHVFDEEAGPIECYGLTAIVSDQYTSFSDGTYRRNPEPPEFYCMGIKTCGFDDPAWRIQIVKKFNDVIDGENWPRYGFSYKTVDESLVRDAEDAA
ncbi:hypothetical protein [Roseibium alexandrii]|uniref:hypothetical protein n=1 Tax=Roseibium alexandrii TaxID=388408 RepID=UPI0037504B8E